MPAPILYVAGHAALIVAATGFLALTCVRIVGQISRKNADKP